ncbi:hypothetical protein BGW41_007328 [Actinomortierella wolfii]|nr:hypothetical protein BGW41_007328 [Actinomortierella wolfii]
MSAVVGGGSFLGQTDAQIRNSVATSIMATVHTDDVRVLCAGLDRVCKDQMATWQIRWNVQGTKKIVSRRQEQSPHSGSKLLAQYDHYKEFLDRPTMGRMFEYQGDWFEEWQDPTALAISSSTDDGYNYDELNDDEGEYRWTEMTGVAGEGSLLTLVVRPMTDEDFFEEEEAYSSTHIAVDGRTKSSDSISSSVSYYQYGQHEEHAHRYQKKQQRRRELMAREEGLSWVNNQFGGPMRPLTDSVPSPAFTPQHERRRRQSISGVSSSSISSMCSSTSFSMIPFGPRDHELALYQRRYSRAGSSYSETGYSEYEGSDEGMRQHYYVLEQMARPEIPRSLHLPDAFSHFRQDSHGQTRRMSTLSLSYEIKSPTNRTMSTCSSVMVHHLPPHQQPLYSGIGEASMTAMTATVGTATTTTATNSTSGWQVTSLPSVMSLPSRTLPPWTVLSTIALEAWQMWIQTIHAGQDQFQEWCEYVIDLAVDQTIENFMTAYRVVGWIAESRAFLVIKSSSALMIFTPSSSKGPTRGGEAIQRSTQRSPRYSGARASLPAVSRRNSMSVSRTDSTTWPPRKMRLKSSQEWLRRHQQQVKRRRQSLHLQGGTGMGDASILEEMREEDEEYEGDDVYDEDQVHNMSLFAIGEQSASSTISTTATTVSKQSPSRPGLHRRHWSANNVPQLPTSKSLLFEDTDPSHSLTTVMTTTKASGMERAGKLLGQVPVVGRVTRFVGASWVGKKIKGRLELQQDRIDEVLDQVVDWLEVAANTLPVVGNGSLRTSITTVTFSTITNRG